MDPTASPPPSLMSRIFTAPKLSFNKEPMKPGDIRNPFTSKLNPADMMLQRTETEKMFSPDVLVKMQGEGAEDLLGERLTGVGSPLLSIAPDQTMLDINKARDQVKLDEASSELNQPAPPLPTVEPTAAIDPAESGGEAAGNVSVNDMKEIGAPAAQTIRS